MTSTQKMSIYVHLEHKFLFSDRERARDSPLGLQDAGKEDENLFNS
jgi:hypothetical protein